MDDKLLSELSKIELFRTLNIEDVRYLFTLISYKIKIFNKNEIIKFSRDPLINAYFLLEGQITANMETPNGKLLQIEKINAPNLVAAGFLFSKTKTSPVDVFISQKFSRILFVPYNDFLKLIFMNKTVMMNFLHFMGNKLSFLSEKIRIIGLNTLTQKVCSYLFSLYKNCGDSFTLPITKEEMANLFGATRPSVSRVFGLLEKDKVIKRDKNTITVIDCDKLLKKALN